MQPIGNYLPDFSKKHPHSDSRFEALEAAVIELAATVKSLKAEIHCLKYKGRDE